MATIKICYTDSNGQRVCPSSSQMQLQAGADTAQAGAAATAGKAKKGEAVLEMIDVLLKAARRKGQDEMADEPAEIWIEYKA